MAKNYLKENIFTLALVVLSIFVIVNIPSQVKESLLSASTISPRLFPYIASGGILICSILNLILDFIGMVLKVKRGEEIPEKKRNENVSVYRAIGTVALVFVWLFILEKIGFIISTIIILFVLSFMMGNRNKILLVLFPVCFTLLIYFVFGELLHVSLPEILF
ncbi:MAG: tripartite tricarboxylate transporter TctB family protein [Lachnospiraceae bacterium]|nr:tripartite tricarboxylate transporter TctB family protein [Lachnospiraceae bacterium]